MLRKVIELEATVRERNQLTLPAEAAAELGVAVGDRVVLSIPVGEHYAIVRPVRASYAGVAVGLYGSPEEVAAYVEGERAAWE